MRLLLDTHIILAIVDKVLPDRFPAIAKVIVARGVVNVVSVASIWEIAIKTRLGKLVPALPVAVIPGYLQSIGTIILPVGISHVTAAADPEPETRDPFDRLLLAQCQVEGLKLVTVDRALADHPAALQI